MNQSNIIQFSEVSRKICPYLSYLQAINDPIFFFKSPSNHRPFSFQTNLKYTYKYITMKEQQEACRAAIASLDYRKFLEYFKTKPCPYEAHCPEYCSYYHLECRMINNGVVDGQEDAEGQSYWIARDRRRNCYGKLNRILYFGEYCSNIVNGCQNQECKYCHNIWEYNYHPLVFKTIACERFYDCNYQFCALLHYYDYTINPKTQTNIIRFSEFFRFDIMTFKSLPCKKQSHDKHEKTLCLFYHTQNDYRRPNFQLYDHTKCKKVNEQGCSDPNCPYSHNKIQQLYHPSRYKSKFCQSHEISRKNASDSNNQMNFKSLCPYGKFCSFAHDDSEISIQLIDKLERNLQFHLYTYKTVWCPITTQHNRYNCVYAHNVQDFRRNPKQYTYEPVQCPLWKKNQNIKSIQEAGCPDGMNCKKCHGWKEKQYHPIVYSKHKGSDSYQKNKSESFTSSDGGKQKVESSPYFHNKKKSEMLQKKLGAEFNCKSNLESIVQTIFNQKNPQKQLYAPGAPFFKNTPSTKTKTQSQKGGAFKQQAQQQKNSRGEESVLTTKSIAIKGSQKDDSEDIDDTHIFKAFESGNEKTCDQKRSCINWTQKNDSEHQKQYNPVVRTSRTVSKSVGFASRQKNNYYSKDVSQVLNPQILTVLRNKSISEIKLINMKQEQVRKIEQLTNSQKSLIIKKILLARDNARKAPTYERILETHFLRHKRLDILVKMKSKKVKQQKLLLLDSQIKELSFLSESEKRILPKIIAEFKDNKQFQQLNVEIAKSLTPQTQQLRE